MTALKTLQTLYWSLAGKVKSEADIERLFIYELGRNAHLRKHAYDVLRPMLAETAGEGHPSSAPAKGLNQFAPPASPSGDKGQTAIVAKSDRIDNALSPDPVQDEPVDLTTSRAETHVPLPVRPDAKPDERANQLTPSDSPASSLSPSRPAPKGPSPGFIKAMGESRMKMATKVLFTLHDGRDIMKVEMRELPHYRMTGAKQAVICDRILKHSSNADPYWRVEDVVSAASIEKFIAEFDKEHRHVTL
jgi:hypothetical protein